MKVLVTGHRGLVGRAVVDALTATGHDVVGLDLAEGHEVLDAELVLARGAGCDAAVHLVAIDEEPIQRSQPLTTSVGTDSAILRTNIGGMYNVLAAAEQTGMRRVVFLSSVDVLGCFMGLGRPRYFPIDDAHPANPQSTYAWSKLAAEELCRAFTQASGIATVCLRPPGVFDNDLYAFIRQARQENPEFEWSPFWEYGAFIDARDLAGAVTCALTADLDGHHRLLVCAQDISSAHDDSLTLAVRLTPDVPVVSPERYAVHPFAALVDSTAAQTRLGWTPRFSWRDSD
jgi:UDP-glucose 4-epimerase